MENGLIEVEIGDDPEGVQPIDYPPSENVPPISVHYGSDGKASYIRMTNAYSGLEHIFRAQDFRTADSPTPEQLKRAPATKSVVTVETGLMPSSVPMAHTMDELWEALGLV